MPSEKILLQKQQLVAELKEKIEGSMAGVLVSYKGINVEDDTALRRELREAGVDYAVVKNTMLRLAVAGTPYEELVGEMKGSTALAVSKDDPISAAKILSKYADKAQNGFAVKAGFLEGKTLDLAGVSEIAKLPSREELLSMLCSALEGNIRGLAVALNAIVEKDGEGEAA
ncbi:50S ribosomal protein L10 [Neobittarella massiliensis]|uniref:Large ribosomal subunit protein uL10 n=2 Tax=Oscillospiraceae TaxID=216572 RepID=A0A8J6IMI3_9FIRM|nr:50S ribosomal protein L10 [Neobittarella massiliensis]MBC3515008.1 50S ribosomal protein L10 [Neobittarella massiliensis]SCJ67445.1 Vegetative protein 300 [uncultured Anaerotruncus sp.]